jgi:hypothetical protein
VIREKRVNGEDEMTNKKNKQYEEMSLGGLLEEIKSRFKMKPTKKYDIICFHLVCWQRGLWGINVVDDWHKWSSKGIKEFNLLYSSPEEACREFLKYVDVNKINLRSLQSK